MKRFWKKQFMATLLVLAMVVSLMPAAMAAVAAHDHSFASEWSKDSTYHWHACTAKKGCTEKQDKEKHTFEWKNDGTYHWQECSECGYQRSKELHIDTKSPKGECDKAECQGNIEKVTVVFMNGDTVVKISTKESQEIVSGKTPAVPTTVPKYSGTGETGNYKFMGWTTDPNPDWSWEDDDDDFLTTEKVKSTPVIYEETGSTCTYYAAYDVEGGQTVHYAVNPGESVTFSPADFRSVVNTICGGSKTISYVTLYGDVDEDDGTLKAGTKNLVEKDALDGDTQFGYSSKPKDGYALGDVTFKADRKASETTVKLEFSAYDSKDVLLAEGAVEIEILKKVTGGDITLEVEAGKSVAFSASTFRTFLRDELDDSKAVLDYVTFDNATSTTFSEGALYYKTTKLAYNELDDEDYYYSAGTGERALSSLSFTAGTSFKKSVSLSFTAYSDDNDRVSGTLVICTPDTQKGDIEYKVAPGQEVKFSPSDFLSYLKKETDETKLDYVIFEDADSSSVFSEGALYYKTTKLKYNELSDEDYYYTPGTYDSDLSKLSFKAGIDFKKAVSLTFTAYGKNGDYAEGTLVIRSSGASVYAGGIRYATTTGNEILLNANDIVRYFHKEYPSYDLQYVTFTDVPSVGTMYYNHRGASKYGTSSSMAMTSANCSAQNFYVSPTSTSQYALTELTYVPSGTNYCVTIPFVAYGSNRSVSGTILVSVNTSAVKEVYTTTLKGASVNFPASTVYSAVSSASSTATASIQLLTLPAAKVGTVYVGTSTLANTTTAYTYNGTMNQLRFVPATGFTGSVELPYVALNSNGTAIGSGVVSIGVLATAAKKFTDVTTATWCYKYVIELADAKVIDGYADGSFKAGNNVTYGAALKLIMRAAGYPELAPTVKGSTFSGYLAKAQADGIVTGTVDLKKPITRLQAAQLAAKALKLPTNNLSTVKPFTDTSDPYVQALNAAGIVEGYFDAATGTSTYKPSTILTRGHISAIVWRMNNYNK